MKRSGHRRRATSSEVNTSRTETGSAGFVRRVLVPAMTAVVAISCLVIVQGQGLAQEGDRTTAESVYREAIARSNCPAIGSTPRALFGGCARCRG